jgi:hypothetical protein
VLLLLLSPLLLRRRRCLVVLAPVTASVVEPVLLLHFHVVLDNEKRRYDSQREAAFKQQPTVFNRQGIKVPSPLPPRVLKDLETRMAESRQAGCTCARPFAAGKVVTPNHTEQVSSLTRRWGHNGVVVLLECPGATEWYECSCSCGEPQVRNECHTG